MKRFTDTELRHDFLELISREIFEVVYPGKKWPEGWRVFWHRSRSKRVYGTCNFTYKSILLNVRMAEEHGRVVQTLLHEFVHMMNPKLRHGQKFNDQEHLLYIRFFGANNGLETSRDEGIRLRQEARDQRERNRQNNLDLLATALRGKGLEPTKLLWRVG